MLGPPWGRERQWGSESRRRRWQRDRGGIGKSDPNAIVAEGNEARMGLGTGSSGDGGEGDEETSLKRFISKLKSVQNT